MTNQEERISHRKQLLGRGWHFPVRIDLAIAGQDAVGGARGGLALSSYEDDIQQALQIVLSTKPGERRMRPTFGCRIHELVFAPMHETTFGLIRRYVEDAVAMWEPRIDLERITLTPSEGRVDVEIEYAVRATKDERTLVYPFYVIGEEG